MKLFEIFKPLQKTLVEALTEADGKNVHLDHVEELIFMQGAAGRDRVVNTLAQLLEDLEGSSDSGAAVTTKWDGCIHPDLLIKTNRGLLRIEEVIDRVNSGETFEVLQRDLNTNQVTMLPILKAAKKNGEKLWIAVELENGEVLRLTEDHEVYTSNRGWIAAKDLNENDDILEINK